MDRPDYLIVLFDSFKAAFKGRIWAWLLGSVTAVIGLLLAFKNLFSYSIEESVKAGGIIIASLWAVKFIYALLTKTGQYLTFIWRESVYGNAIILLKNSFAQIHSLRKRAFTDKEFMAAMIGTCLNLKCIYDQKTKAKCSISIKVSKLKVISEGSSVKNICRDPESVGRNTEQYSNVNHTIIGNTPYQIIVNNFLKGDLEKAFYHNQDIDSSIDYQNTSREANPKGVLPYKSEIVVPIIPLSWEGSRFEMIGFICVDCNMKNKFNSKYDVAILQGVADGLYDVVQEWIKNN